MSDKPPEEPPPPSSSTEAVPPVQDTPGQQETPPEPPKVPTQAEAPGPPPTPETGAATPTEVNPSEGDPARTVPPQLESPETPTPPPAEETAVGGSDRPGPEAAMYAELSPAEQQSFDRFKETPWAEGRDFSKPDNAGQDWKDDQGRTYDQMGDPRASEHWDQQKDNFLSQVDRHLGKADHPVIDLTGFTPDQVATVDDKISTLSPADQARIIRIGF